MNIQGILLNNQDIKEAVEHKQYVFDSSMAGKELLQNYLTILYPEQEPENKINDIIIEELFKKGLHAKLQFLDVKNEIQTNIEFQYKLNENWLITGTMDVLYKTPDIWNDGKFLYEIYENKLAYDYTLSKFLQNNTMHPYTKELQISRYLIMINNPDELVDAKLNFFIKDIKNTSNDTSLTTWSIDRKTTNNIEKKLNSVTEELQDYIESGDIPPVCSDLWWREVDNKDIPTKCTHYCEHGKSGNCPYYDNKTEKIKEL